MALTFVPEIEWPDNPILLSADLFNVTVPVGLSGMNIRAPKYVGYPTMEEEGGRSSTQVGKGLGTMKGLVSPDIEARFEDVASQWRSRPLGGLLSRQGPAQFRFNGGKVSLILRLKIFVLEGFAPKLDDECSVKTFAEIYGHELLHVLDEIEILKNWLIPKLNSESTISKFLVRGEPFDYGTGSQPMSRVEQGFYSEITKTIASCVKSVWAPESDRRVALRDSPQEYGKVADRIGELQRTCR